MLALGITGALKQLSNTDLYRYLVQEHDLTTVAALLGTACAWRGSAKNDVAKMCFLHVPAVHPVAFPEVEVSLLAQSAALVSIGLLYQQTSHRRTVEIVLREIGADPDRTSARWGGGGGNETQSAHSKGGREGYALCAGFALGLTCLGVGETAVGLSDLRIVERLKRYLGGGGGGGAFPQPVRRFPADAEETNATRTKRRLKTVWQAIKAKARLICCPATPTEAWTGTAFGVSQIMLRVSRIQAPTFANTRTHTVS